MLNYLQGCSQVVNENQNSQATQVFDRKGTFLVNWSE